MWTALDWFGIGHSDGFCGNGNELSCSIKDQEFIDYLRVLASSKVVFFFTKCIGYWTIFQCSMQELRLSSQEIRRYSCRIQ
jgi:hypothetical protein